ncbi:MAG: nickel pincer cofactor biosynthesis protein LarB [Thermomicrobiales bacterium]|nr:nickel pincer cofactor biosynthesis protein LarB [Thermomicrobiales bacterium]
MEQAPSSDPTSVRLDLLRAERTGVPEVVLAGSKPAEHLITALSGLAQQNGRAVASRCRPEDIEAIQIAFDGKLHVEIHHSTVVVAQYNTAPRSNEGKVGILTAGSSDIVVATEAEVLLREMGVEIVKAHDVGVAGLHRLVGPLRRLAEENVDAIVVAAGMDGALPSVVAGLVPVPVIGLPVSTGYGVGGNGEAALHSMLQSCAPGLAVVNIDNGIGAAACAGLIARRAAEGRRING